MSYVHICRYAIITCTSRHCLAMDKINHKNKMKQHRIIILIFTLIKFSCVIISIKYVATCHWNNHTYACIQTQFCLSNKLMSIWPYMLCYMSTSISHL